jgi:hypothetical protein
MLASTDVKPTPMLSPYSTERDEAVNIGPGPQQSKADTSQHHQEDYGSAIPGLKCGYAPAENDISAVEPQISWPMALPGLSEPYLARSYDAFLDEPMAQDTLDMWTTAPQVFE